MNTHSCDIGVQVSEPMLSVVLGVYPGAELLDHTVHVWKEYEAGVGREGRTRRWRGPDRRHLSVARSPALDNTRELPGTEGTPLL